MDKPYTAVIPERIEATRTGSAMVMIDVEDREREITLMLFSRQARELRDRLNAMNLESAKVA
jgi:3,4-dihydroxy-2-butanone 4-phosphate synthase